MNKKYIKYINYIVNDIEKPYLKYLNMYGLKQEECELILSKVYNQSVTIEGENVYDNQGNLIYYENGNGFWEKREYDDNDKIIYFEDSYGYWSKWEYDTNGNQIYFEDSSGYIEDNR